jgi:hypothetical protein
MVCVDLTLGGFPAGAVSATVQDHLSASPHGEVRCWLEDLPARHTEQNSSLSIPCRFAYASTSLRR